MPRLLPLALAALLVAACNDGPGTDKDDVTDTGPTTGPVDADRDGYDSTEDCDDNDASVHPGGTEVCDGVDNDCDDLIDEEVTTTYYADQDQDGFGDPDRGQDACEKPQGYVPTGTDCDDADPAAYPGGTEVCDGVDNDCDGVVDDGLSETWYADNDGDGYGDPDSAITSCDGAVPGYVQNDLDCDDGSALAYPGASEVCDEIDNDCDGDVDEDVTTTYYVDMDGDGYGNASRTSEACSLPTGYSTNPLDCDDAVTEVHPGATEYCNSRDDDCDGITDEDDAADAVTWYRDADGDTYGDASATDVECTVPSGYVANDDDCDDARAESHPGADEYCNTYDDDCDGTIDEDDALDVLTWHQDRDEDGFGDPSRTDIDCDQPTGFVADGTDCNDLNAAVYPGADEYCNGTDDDCDGTTDEDDALDAPTWYRDADGDTYGDATVADVECTAPTGYVADATDCDDARAETYPGADEYCNGTDDDCDGTTDEDDAVDATTWYRDADRDGFGNPSFSDVQCTAPSGFVADNTDCDDTRATVHPGSDEYCNTRDDDCDGTIDEDDALDAITWYRDADGDTYGDPAVTDVECTVPTGYVANDDDCDDTDATSFPGGTEVCDGADNDCNGTVDDDPIDGDIFYADADSDGTGDPGRTMVACSVPSGFADNAWDCDDGDASEPVVVDGATGSASGVGTIASPLDSIQDALDRADACVIVFAGTYEEQLDLGGASVDLWGVEGQDTTFIDADLATCSYLNPTACSSTVTIASGTGAVPTIHGFTIRGGTGTVSSTVSTQPCADSSASHAGRNTCTVTVYEYCGGGVYVEGDDPIFYDVVIEDNTLPAFDQVAVGDFTQYWLYSYGGGLCAVDAVVTMEDGAIYDNYADQGGGFYATDHASLTLVHTVLMDNTATDGGAGNVERASLVSANTIIACNAATTDGGALFLDGSTTSANLVNLSLYADTSATGTTHGAGVYGGASTVLSLSNSIVYTTISAYALYGAGTGTIAYTDVYNSASSAYTYGGTYAAGTGAISANPQFTSVSCDGNPNNDDFSLRTGSAAIDAGNPSTAHNDADGSRNDMGAYGGPDGAW